MLKVVLVGVATIIGAITANDTNTLANAQFAPSNNRSGDAWWHLPKRCESGWFRHSSNGCVRAWNMDKMSVVGE